jgi:hypothetical protein
MTRALLILAALALPAVAQVPREAVLANRCAIATEPAGCLGEKLTHATIYPAVPCALDMPTKGRWVEALIAGKRACAMATRTGRLVLADPVGGQVYAIKARPDQLECVRVWCDPDMHVTTGARK